MSASESLENKLVRQQLAESTLEQSAPQASTNTPTLVPASLLNAKGKKTIQYVVNNSGANTITAQIMGRIVTEDGEASAWVATTLGAQDVAAAANVGLSLTANPFTQVGIFIDAKVDGAQGAATVFGQASA